MILALSWTAITKLGIGIGVIVGIIVLAAIDAKESKEDDDDFSF